MFPSRAKSVSQKNTFLILIPKRQKLYGSLKKFDKFFKVVILGHFGAKRVITSIFIYFRFAQFFRYGYLYKLLNV